MLKKDQAKRDFCLLSYGTLATLTGLSKYDDLDKALEQILDKINNTDISKCQNWADVWQVIQCN